MKCRSLQMKGKKMLRILFFLMVAVLLALADGPVLQTGQTKSYDASGTVVTDGSIKDDGYYQKGVTRSYSSSEDVIIDNATGLEWQDNESVTKPWTKTGGDTAANYCASLLPSGEWRLPAIQELQTLVDNGHYHPSVTPSTFIHYVPSDDYWSSTADAFDASDAWTVNFDFGYSSFWNKGDNNYVRCVRGEQLTTSALSRNDTTKIVTDTTTGLQWQDDIAAEQTKQNWIGAIDYCEEILVLGGYNDWRLPNINELLSILDYTRYKPTIDLQVFQHTAFEDTHFSNYWSSTTDAGNTYFAWVVAFDYGSAYGKNKDFNRYVRCVRGGQVPINPSIIMYLLN